MTDEEFARYERRIRDVLGRCGCDEHWPNELCESCTATVARYMRELEDQKAGHESQ